MTHDPGFWERAEFFGAVMEELERPRGGGEGRAEMKHLPKEKETEGNLGNGSKERADL